MPVIHVSNRLSVLISHDEIARVLLGGPRRREAAIRHLRLAQLKRPQLVEVPHEWGLPSRRSSVSGADTRLERRCRYGTSVCIVSGCAEEGKRPGDGVRHDKAGVLIPRQTRAAGSGVASLNHRVSSSILLVV